MENRAIAGPAPLTAATAKASRAPHAADPHAGRQGARTTRRPTVGAEAHLGGESADGAHDRAGELDELNTHCRADPSCVRVSLNQWVAQPPHGLRSWTLPQRQYVMLELHVCAATLCRWPAASWRKTPACCGGRWPTRPAAGSWICCGSGRG